MESTFTKEELQGLYNIVQLSKKKASGPQGLISDCAKNVISEAGAVFIGIVLSEINDKGKISFFRLFSLAQKIYAGVNQFMASWRACKESNG